ncbi:MAG TPA: SRPBCC domain-containing protein [Thermomicrobiales bacterium]|nr:SRPBCC domain-containing protein [Thermomicrobiales bacterium]
MRTAQAVVTIDATPEDVFRALTESDQLNEWFSEHSDIALDDGRYDFWGRHTVGAPEREEGRHTIETLEHGRRLVYRWRLSGQDSTVDIRLAPVGGGVELSLRHDGLTPRALHRTSLYDFWSLALENLRAWCERGQIGSRPDFALSPLADAVASVQIEAPAEEVFDALLDPAQIGRFAGGEQPVVERRRGGRYSFGWEGGGPIKILEIVPNERLAYSWSHGDPETVVTWTLEGSGGGTRLTLVHSGFAPDQEREDYRIGWLHFLNRIKHMVEQGPEWRPIEIVSEELHYEVAV